MNDKDKEAFVKYMGENLPFSYYVSYHCPKLKTWQAACEYKDKEINDDEELLRDHMNSIGYRELKKLQAENKKLRQELEIAKIIFREIKFDGAANDIEEALKQVEKKG
jgi:hypothetical protein